MITIKRMNPLVVKMMILSRRLKRFYEKKEKGKHQHRRLYALNVEKRDMLKVNVLHLKRRRNVSREIKKKVKESIYCMGKFIF